MDYEAIKTQFLEDVKSHTMAIQADDPGIGYRRIIFSKYGYSSQRFELVTWPNYLCITGDMGTYVFSRIYDMFKFFRSPELITKPGYWSEKLQADDTHSKHKGFSREIFGVRVWDFYYMAIDIGIDFERAEKLKKSIQDEVISYSDEERSAYDAIENWPDNACVPEEYEDIFQDFFDGGGTEDYSYHFIWCLYAIVWGINKYDEKIANQ